jgi:iron(III) transport system ATP-binding protein
MPGEVVEASKNKDLVYVRTEFCKNLLCSWSGETEISAGKTVYASIRPEDVDVYAEPPQPAQNLFKSTIVHKAYLGNFMNFFMRINDTMIRVQVPHHLPQEEGQELYLYLNPEKCMLLI